jgi:hypothetical protein
VRNVSDFKTVTSYRLIGKDQYELVAPGGEIKHGTLGNETYSNRADTYGLMLSIDRRDIINDDLGAITTVPQKLGRGSGLKINDVFWTTFLNNAAFFTAGNACIPVIRSISSIPNLGHSAVEPTPPIHHARQRFAQGQSFRTARGFCIRRHVLASLFQAFSRPRCNSIIMQSIS